MPMWARPEMGMGPTFVSWIAIFRPDIRVAPRRSRSCMPAKREGRANPSAPYCQLSYDAAIAEMNKPPLGSQLRLLADCSLPQIELRVAFFPKGSTAEMVREVPVGQDQDEAPFPQQRSGSWKLPPRPKPTQYRGTRA